MNRGHNAKVENGTLADHKPAVRKCLGRECGKVFQSKGPANRFCATCRGRQERSGSVHRALFARDVK